jgi:membrane protease YdiL (CAAX protease family)
MATSPEQAVQRTHACALTLSMPFLAVNLLDGFTKAALATSPTLFWTYDVTKWVLLPAVTLFAMRVWCGARAADFGLHGPGPCWSPAQLSGLCALFTALAMSYFAFRSLAAPFFTSNPSFELEELLPEGAARLPAVLYLCATAAVVEELFYRGVLLEAMAPLGAGVGPAIVYVVVSSTLFGLSHFESSAAEVLATGLYGVVAAVFALRVRNLWPLIAGHFVTDFVAFY